MTNSGQAGHFGQPGDAVPPPPPRKSKLPWVLAGGGVLVIAIAVVLILTLTGGPDTATPRSVADAAVQAVNKKDVTALRAVLCDANVLSPEIGLAIAAASTRTDITIDARLDGDPVQTGDKAVAKFQVHGTFAGRSADQTITVSMIRRDDSWCMDTFSAPNLVP